MATFTLDLPNIERAVSLALEEGVRHLQGEIVKITPRDPKRLPKDPSRKVTGNLKRSIQYEKKSNTRYKVGVVGAGVKGDEIVSKGDGLNPAQYGVYLEFGTIRMKPRSFIRKAYVEQRDNIANVINKVFRLYI